MSDATATPFDERFRRMIERLPFGVIVHDERGDIRFANAPASDLAGFASSHALVGGSIGDLFAGPYLWNVRERLLAPGEDAAPPGLVHRQLTRVDGLTVDVEVAATPFLAGAEGEVQLVFHDIGPRLRAEEARARTAAQLLLLLAQLPGMLWTTDTAGVITSSHSSAGSTPRLGSRPGELDGRPLAQVFGAPAEALVEEALGGALRGERTTCEIPTADRTASVEMGPLRATAEAGAIDGTVGLAIDVTDRRRRERQRHEREHLAALGRVSGGVAHGLNNILATIMARAEVMRLESTTPDSREDLDAIIAATQRGGTLVSGLLGFARAGKYQPETLEVSDLVHAAAARAEDHLHGAVALRVELAPRWLHVEGDQHQLSAILDALIANALEAGPHQGPIMLRTSRVEVTATDLTDEQVSPGSFVCIEVDDAGVGMPADVRERAFDPYFTTRGDGRGLGLSMVHGVAHHHDGFVRLVSEVGAGTRVRLLLPLSTASVEPAPPAAPVRPAPSPGRGAALVVDDEAQIRAAARRSLAHLGYTAVEAEDGPAALAAFVAPRPIPFAFVLLDMRMPVMAGDEVLRRLIAIDPDVRVIICTGYDRDQVTQAQFAQGRVGFLRKPFTLAQLQAEIATVTADL